MRAWGSFHGFREWGKKKCKSGWVGAVRRRQPRGAAAVESLLRRVHWGRSRPSCRSRGLFGLQRCRSRRGAGQIIVGSEGGPARSRQLPGVASRHQGAEDGDCAGREHLAAAVGAVAHHRRQHQGRPCIVSEDRRMPCQRERLGAAHTACSSCTGWAAAWGTGSTVLHLTADQPSTQQRLAHPAPAACRLSGA